MFAEKNIIRMIGKKVMEDVVFAIKNIRITGIMASAPFADMPVVSTRKGGGHTMIQIIHVMFADINPLMFMERIFCMTAFTAAVVWNVVFKKNILVWV